MINVQGRDFITDVISIENVFKIDSRLDVYKPISFKRGLVIDENKI